jgi:hypothetical protein
VLIYAVSSATPPILMPDGAAVCRAVPRHTSKRRANMAPMRWAVFGRGARRRRRGSAGKSPMSMPAARVRHRLVRLCTTHRPHQARHERPPLST